MNRLNVLKVALIAIYVPVVSIAQDIHFAQMEYAPMVLNPALAGANANLQGVVNYRTQWSAVAAPYKTMAASIDGRLNAKSRNSNGHLVAGLSAYNDQSGDAKISSNGISLAIGYHIILDPTSKLGFAIYTGLGQRAFNNSNGKWGSQYDGMNYVVTLPSGEPLSSAQFSYFDAGAGFVYTYKEKASSMRSNTGKLFNYGFALYHLNRPNYSFYNSTDEHLYMRFTVFGNCLIGIGNSKWLFNPGVYYQRQKSAQEILIGSYFKYQLSDASHITARNKAAFFSLGLFYRTKDALVAKSMLEWSDYSVGFAYDINTSGLTRVSNARGGAEFFLKYTMSDQKRWIR